MIRHCIFDFDGTLADTSRGIICTVQETLRLMGLPQQDDERIKRTIGLPLCESIRQGGAVPDERVQEGVDTYRRIFFDVAGQYITLFPGVEETLKYLAESGYTLSIATSRGRNSLSRILHAHGIDGIFSEIATSDGDYRPKPAPDIVLWLLDRLGAQAAETLVVGDTTFDLMMGSGAGCRTCGVTWGNHSAEMLQSASPDFLIDSFEELIPVLR